MKLGKIFGLVVSFWFASVFVVLIAFAFAIYFYKGSFGGGFSSTSADWSNFGGYIGGTLGPLVSFITLLAVLKTVYLQRELLDTQRAEFKSMQALQRETFDSQQEQIKQASEATRLGQYDRVVDHLLSMVDRHSALYESLVSRATQGAQTLLEWSLKGQPVKQEQMQKLYKEIESNKATITKLAALSIDLSMKRFETIEDLREFYRSEMFKILDDA
ncbi:hypothetical protein [Pseudomonas paracarnis]|uniref:hypothetical protein n=1 Tax=Pseudomonas paracarnis TaxID=2750625 RepID=UPI0023DE8D5C|nr:hypothetical protein [Pseudomonas paracarnis]MDF3188079.1 hypothetical protein [Pseudomonas paracarnis]